jgi:hypothetical protein
MGIFSTCKLSMSNASLLFYSRNRCKARNYPGSRLVNREASQLALQVLRGAPKGGDSLLRIYVRRFYGGVELDDASHLSQHFLSFAHTTMATVGPDTDEAPSSSMMGNGTDLLTSVLDSFSKAVSTAMAPALVLTAIWSSLTLST